MKSKINNKINLFSGTEKNDLFFERKMVWAQGGENAPPPNITDGQEGPDKSKEKPQKPTSELKKEAREQIIQATLDRSKRVLDKGKDETEAPKKDDLIDGLINLAGGGKKKPTDMPVEPSSAQLTAMKDIMQKVPKGEVISLQRDEKVNDSVIKTTIERSTDVNGKNFFKVTLYATTDSKGNAPNVFGAGASEKVMYFNAETKMVDKVPPGTKFNEEAANLSKYRVENNDKDPNMVGLAAVLEKAFGSSERKAFEDQKATILTLLTNLQLNGQPEDGKDIRLPGGYSVFNKKGPYPEAPSTIIYKDGKALCFMINNKLHLSTQSKEVYQDRYSETIAASRTLDLALRDVKYNREKDDLVIPPNSAVAIKASLINMAKFISDSYKRNPKNLNEPSYTYTLPTTRANLAYWRMDDTKGFFKVSIDGKVFAFDTTKPNEFLVKDNKEKFVKRTPDSLVLNADQRARERGEENTKKAEEADKIKYNKEITDAKVIVSKEVAEAEARANFDAITNPRYREYLKSVQNQSDQVKVDFSTTLKDGKQVENSSNEITRLNKLKLTDLFASDCKQVIRITINRNNKDINAMFYPGQDNFYILDAAGKQTKDRMTIRNGETIKIAPTTDVTQDDVKAINPQKAPKIKVTPESLNKLRLVKERTDLLKKFKEVKGTINDLDQKALDNIKNLKKVDGKETFAKYESSTILTDNRDLATNPDATKAIKVDADQNIVIKAENTIIKEGIINLRAKAMVDKARAAAKPPAAPSIPAAAPGTAPGPTLRGGVGEGEETEELIKEDVKNTLNIRNNLVNLLHSKLGGPVGLKALITENDHAQLKIISKQCNGPNSNYNDLQILYPKTDNIHNDNHPLYKKELEILQRIQKEKLSGPATQPTAPSRPAAAPGIPPAAPSKPAAAPGTAPGPTLKGGVGENGETEEVIKDDVRNTLNTRNNLVNLLHSKLDGPVGLKALITENDHAQLKIVSKQCNGENSIYNDMQILYPKTDNIHNDNHLLYKKELEILQRIQKEKNIK